jgi:hypothetical protein
VGALIAVGAIGIRAHHGHDAGLRDAIEGVRSRWRCPDQGTGSRGRAPPRLFAGNMNTVNRSEVQHVLAVRDRNVPVNAAKSP